MKYIVFFLGTVVAFWVSAICGGGASLVLIPMLSLSLTSTQIPAALTIGTFTSSVSRIMVFRKHIHWKIVWFFVPPAIPTVWLGAWVLKFVNPIYLQFFIGLFLVINVRQLFLSKKQVLETERPYPEYVLVIVGALAGFVSGVTGAVGLLFNRFYLRYGLSKEQIVATRAANEIILHLIKLGLYYFMGLFTTESVLMGLMIAVGAVISSFSIKHILPLLSELIFRKIGYAAMSISGLFLLFKTSTTIIAQDHPSIHISPFSNSLETQLAWRKSEILIELEYDEGFQIEHQVLLTEIPEKFHPQIHKLIAGADEVIYEEVSGFSDHYYEIYITKGGMVEKFDLK